MLFLCHELSFLFLFHRALQGMLGIPRRRQNLSHLGFGYLERIDPAQARAAPVNMEHDARGFLTAFVEKSLENLHDELHGRIIVVKQKNLVERRFLGFGLGCHGHAGARCYNLGIVVLVSPCPDDLRCCPHAMKYSIG